MTGSDQQWQGFGRVGLVPALLWEHLGDRLDEQVTGSPYAITNPGFENGADTPTAWQMPGWAAAGGGTWAHDTTVSRSGTASLKLRSAPRTATATSTPGPGRGSAPCGSEGGACRQGDLYRG
ncbi:hypothetical protein AQJ46_30955 [Streptomyces canus]|uniref:Uncharacterized protein n=1 Tax=Streptomyces canus TaxID=58343 RepID=A0A124HX54_9ACTN|nr:MULTISPECIES: hypothetical protein [Streptomyces]KUN63686.1 hypothetical protein AQJ46_30955 [Streptomyces canus]MDI5909281.1 hypothetical protein [Streptomyces sp. 12257]